jgi:hypothetical protein
MTLQMDSNIPTSFIPKKPLMDGAGVPKRSINFFSLIANFIFVIVVILSGAVFGYQYYVQHSIDQVKVDIEAEQANFNDEFIGEVSRLDSRIESSKILLNQHVALSGFFDFLSSVTLHDVRFSSFSYSSKEKGASVVIGGKAPSFTALALQASEMLKKENQPYLSDPVFSDFNLDQSGNVTFSVLGTVDANKFLYRNTIDQALQPAAVSNQTAPQASTTQTTTQ